MRMNKKDLKKIIYGFNSITNRLLKADFADYLGIMKKYVTHIKNTPIIYDYVVDCGPCKQNMEQEFKEVKQSFGDCIFDLGNTDEEEVCNVFEIMNYIVDNNIEVHWSVAGAYSSSDKSQDKVNAFNDRVIMVFIRHIEDYLTKIGIDMGMDENISYNITVSGGQVNIANDNAIINATNNTGIDTQQLMELIAKVKETASDISDDDKESLTDSLEVIEDLAKPDKPKRSFVKTAITTLKAIKGTAEFAAAVTALITFIQTLQIT